MKKRVDSLTITLCVGTIATYAWCFTLPPATRLPVLGAFVAIMFMLRFGVLDVVEKPILTLGKRVWRIFDQLMRRVFARAIGYSIATILLILAILRFGPISTTKALLAVVFLVLVARLLEYDDRLVAWVLNQGTKWKKARIAMSVATVVAVVLIVIYVQQTP